MPITFAIFPFFILVKMNPILALLIGFKVKGLGSFTSLTGIQRIFFKNGKRSFLSQSYNIFPETNPW